MGVRSYCSLRLLTVSFYNYTVDGNPRFCILTCRAAVLPFALPPVCRGGLLSETAGTTLTLLQPLRCVPQASLHRACSWCDLGVGRPVTNICHGHCHHDGEIARCYLSMYTCGCPEPQVPYLWERLHPSVHRRSFIARFRHHNQASGAKACRYIFFYRKNYRSRFLFFFPKSPFRGGESGSRSEVVAIDTSKETLSTETIDHFSEITLSWPRGWFPLGGLCGAVEP